MAIAALVGGAGGYAIAASTAAASTSMPVSAVLITLGCALFGAGTWWLSLTDFRERRLPNAVVLSATVALTLPCSVASVVQGTPAILVQSWVIVLLLSALLLLMWWWFPHFMGAGDVKLVPAAAFLPAWVSPEAGLLIFPLMLCAATAVCGAAARWQRASHIAYGPVLLAASWAAAFVGAP